MATRTVARKGQTNSRSRAKKTETAPEPVVSDTETNLMQVDDDTTNVDEFDAPSEVPVSEEDQTLADKIDRAKERGRTLKSKIVATEQASAAELRETWYDYGAVMLDLRKLITSPKMFGQAAEELDFRSADGKPDRMTRNAAMRYASLPVSMRDLLADNYPDTSNPRAVMRRYDMDMGELASLARGLLAEEGHDLTKSKTLSHKPNSQQKLTKPKTFSEEGNKYSPLIQKGLESMKASAYRDKMLALLQASVPADVALAIATHQPPPPSTKFVDVGPEEAASRLLTMIGKHPYALAVWEAIKAAVPDEQEESKFSYVDPRDPSLQDMEGDEDGEDDEGPEVTEDDDFETED